MPRLLKSDNARYATATSRRNRAFAAAMKLEYGCRDCGYNTYAGSLDFDHVPSRGEKSFNIARAATRSIAALLAEMQKCDVVCANCHRVRTAARLGIPKSVGSYVDTWPPKE